VTNLFCQNPHANFNIPRLRGQIGKGFHTPRFPSCWHTKATVGRCRLQGTIVIFPDQCGGLKDPAVGISLQRWAIASGGGGVPREAWHGLACPAQSDTSQGSALQKRSHWRCCVLSRCGGGGVHKEMTRGRFHQLYHAQDTRELTNVNAAQRQQHIFYVCFLEAVRCISATIWFESGIGCCMLRKSEEQRRERWTRKPAFRSRSSFQTLSS